MNINEKDFFHQATIRICGSLEIDQALLHSFLYLKDFIPLDEMWLALFDKDIGALRAIAIADFTGAKKMDTIVPLPHNVRTEIDKQDFTPKKVTIINRMELNPMALNLSIILGYPESSCMIFPLLTDSARLGVLVMRAGGKDRYLDSHARWVAMLHDPFAVAMSNALRHEDVLKLKDMLADDNQYLTRELRQLAGDKIVGADSGLKNVMDMVHQVAPRDNPVLLMGETGVGKEVVANAIHYASPRKEGPFIKVNSGAIPEGLIDSELFGHEKGAFTGAVSQKRGRFERAHGGTIFLDEIGDLPMQAQSRLLRVIQQKELERVGGTKTITVDTRIIAATHRNLEQMVGNNRFREDLWYRLSVFPIVIPPLRQRNSDIPALVEHFLKRKTRELNFRGIPPIAPGAIERLIDYPWKGNVRELENMVERALIQYSGGLLNFGHFIFSQADDTPVLSKVNGRKLKLDELIASHIRLVLEETQGKISGAGGAAELLGINPNTLRCRMDKLGIKYGKKKQVGHITNSQS
ncbi:MAG: sigma 54-interacting transcriptional regulator [Proteobacteria bacterium]|nr:sigma 54-interacting transcriptional regulator [Pseudomonadota bacterium]MBU4010469.1 sigma 54-interacting transcriptional regulator [Pseudomonadota bacterium]